MKRDQARKAVGALLAKSLGGEFDSFSKSRTEFSRGDSERMEMLSVSPEKLGGAGWQIALRFLVRFGAVENLLDRSDPVRRKWKPADRKWHCTVAALSVNFDHDLTEPMLDSRGDPQACIQPLVEIYRQCAHEFYSAYDSLSALRARLEGGESQVLGYCCGTRSHILPACLAVDGDGEALMHWARSLRQETPGAPSVRFLAAIGTEMPDLGISEDYLEELRRERQREGI